MAIIKVENLVKDYKVRIKKEETSGIKDLFFRTHITKRAVNDISFSIDNGEIVGYLGPNGAGKSTTIKMLTGILTPTSGTISVNGMNPYHDRRRYVKEIGVVFGQRTQLWWDIPVRDSLLLLKTMYKIDNRRYQENMQLFSEVLGIDDIVSIPVRQLSLGQRMRADLCAALLHNPPIVFLDEPTIGLDAIAKQNMRKFVKKINERRETTVILTTHDMGDIEKLCRQVIVIDKGKIVYSGDLENLKFVYGYMEYAEIVLGQPPENIDWFRRHQIEIRTEDHKIYLRYNRNQINIIEIMEHINQSSHILNMELKEAELEEAIGNLYKEQQGRTI